MRCSLRSPVFRITPGAPFLFETARRAAQPAQACLRWGRRFAAPWKDSTSPENTTNNHRHLPNTQTQSRKKKPPSQRRGPRRCANNAPLRLSSLVSEFRARNPVACYAQPRAGLFAKGKHPVSLALHSAAATALPGRCPLRVSPGTTQPRSLRAQRSRHRQSAVSRPLLCAPFTRKRASRIFRRQPNRGGGCRSKNVLTGTVSQSEGRPL